MNKFIKYTFLGALTVWMGFSISCTEEEPINLPPSFKLTGVSDIMRTTATFAGTVSGDVSSIKSYGFEYSTSENFPGDQTWTLEMNGTPSSSVIATATGLEANERYYYRLFATTGASKVFSSAEYFQTLSSSAPLLSALEVDSIGENIARFRCTVEDIGDEYLLEYGVSYKKVSDQAYVPVPSDSIVAGTSNTYFVEIIDLDPATKYMFRPYAKNSADATGETGAREGYGSVIEEKTQDQKSAVVTTSEIVSGNIGINSVTVSGMVKSANASNGKIDAYGFCWSDKNNTPVITDDHMEIDTPVELGKYFTATITDLEPNSIYYVRAYAKNTVDGEERYGYGEVYEITTGTLVTPKIEIDMENDGQGNYFNTYEITSSSIHYMATITNYDEAALVAKGLIWSNSDPNITLDKAKERGTVLSLDINEGGRHIDGSINDLESNTHYFLYAYAVYEAAGIEKIGYSEQLSFSTKAINLPSSSGWGSYTDGEGYYVFTSGLSNYGDGEITEIGYIWRKYNEEDDSQLTIENCDGQKAIKVDNYSDFAITIKEFKPNSVYDFYIYVKSMIEGKEYISYLCPSKFTTGDPKTPSLDYIQLESNSLTSVTVSCSVNGAGEGEIVERGFVWLLDPFDGYWKNPTIEDCTSYKAANDGTDEKFLLEITGLNINTQYYFRAYAKMKYDDKEYISYSNSEPWSTQNYSMPEFKSINVSEDDITYSSVVLTGGFHNEGNSMIVKSGFCISESSKTSQPTINNNDFLVDADASYKATLTGLKHDTEYAVRFYAICKQGDNEETIYSGTTHFRTKRPKETTFNNVNISNVLMSSVTISSGIAEYGDGEVIESGIIWKKGYWEHPTFENNYYDGYQKLTTDEKEFTVDVTGLMVATDYSFKIYVKTKVEGVEYIYYSGYECTRTGALNINLRVDEITLTSCKLVGIADYDLPEGITEYGFSISTEDISSYDMTDLRKGSDLNDNKEFSLDITGLTMNTRYYVGIYVKIGDKVYHADGRWEFTTKNIPTIDSNPSPDKKD